MIGSLILFTEKKDATVTLRHDSGPSFTVSAMNGEVIIGPFDLPDGNGASLTIDKVSYRGVLWMSVTNPQNGSASFAVDTFPFDSSAVKWPDDAALRNFAGNFGGEIVPGITGPTIRPGLLFTPGYVVESDDNRKRIRETYTGTHFPINLTNHSSIYRDYYRNWDDSLINKYLEELLVSDLIPVCFAMGDSDVSVESSADPNLVPIVIPKWEDPNPFWPTINTFQLVHEKFPKAILGWHCPPGQDAPFQGNGWSNGEVWTQMANWGVSLFLFQGKAWEPQGVQNSIANLTDFINRMISGHPPGYPVGRVSIVDFEETAYYMMNMNGDSFQAETWAKQIRAALPQLSGYCSG